MTLEGRCDSDNPVVPGEAAKASGALSAGRGDSHRPSVSWRKCSDEMPDDDMTVLLALHDGEVWTGFKDGDDWRYVSGDLIEAKVTHWMDFPDPPV